jgi:hypothetical protein
MCCCTSVGSRPSACSCHPCRELITLCMRPAFFVASTESCSCIYGNPCVDEYGCKDWYNRMDVAKKNGWKGF